MCDRENCPVCENDSIELIEDDIQPISNIPSIYIDATQWRESVLRMRQSIAISNNFTLNSTV